MSQCVGGGGILSEFFSQFLSCFIIISIFMMFSYETEWGRGNINAVVTLLMRQGIFFFCIFQSV